MLSSPFLSLLLLASFSLGSSFAKEAPQETKSTKPNGANPSKGFYLRFSGGLSIPQKTSLKRKDPAQTYSWDDGLGSHNLHVLDGSFSTSTFSIKQGPSLGLGVGYQWNPFIRSEIEGQIRFFSIKSSARAHYKNGKGLDLNLKGRLLNVGAMLHTFWDILPHQSLCPFLGAGIGMAANHSSGFKLQNPSYTDEWQPRRNQTKYNLSYQLTAGVHTDLKGVRLELFYRYANLGKFKSSYSEPPIPEIIPANLFPDRVDKTRARLQTHEVMVGLRVPVKLFS